tara:strand:+ start:469 stop:759 length:291 start_codon:yes stop_codon:yes gene_type:complete
MNDQQWLNLALANMHSGQWFGWKKNWTGSHRESYENIIVHDSSITKPTETEVNNKIQELKNDLINAQNARKSAINKLKGATYSALTDAEAKALFGE